MAEFILLRRPKGDPMVVNVAHIVTYEPFDDGGSARSIVKLVGGHLWVEDTVREIILQIVDAARTPAFRPGFSSAVVAVMLEPMSDSGIEDLDPTEEENGNDADPSA